NNNENITTAMIARFLIASCLVATTVMIHAIGLGMTLSHVSHSTVRPDTRVWPITWLLIRIACLLIVIHMFEIAVWALFFWWQKWVEPVAAVLMALTTLSRATGVFFVVVSRLFSTRFKLKTS